MRYLYNLIEEDIKRKIVMISGPRQCGKTTFVKHIAVSNNGIYLNWDIRRDMKIIKDIEWDKTVGIVAFDELHKYIKWKNFLKGLYDEFAGKQLYIVTGSAKLDTFRKQGDALTGRYYHYRMHPIDIYEAGIFFNKKIKLSPKKRLERLLSSGGFPEAYLNPHDAERLRNNRFDLVVNEDLRDLSKVNSLKGITLLIELLRERVGSTINYDNLSKELSVSAPTVKHWVELLERLYVIFLVYPYTKGLSRSIRKECKAYFFDCAAAYNGLGACLENLTACALLKHINYIEDSTGKRCRLMYFRDREKREVDFVVETGRKVKYIIEVKNSDDNLHKNLIYLRERIAPEKSYQLVMNLHRNKEINGVIITDCAQWLDGLTY